MSYEWVWVVVAFAWLVSLIGVRSMAYRHGIWDGAFNHFLPVVQREMIFYDARRAQEIFIKETLELCMLVGAQRNYVNTLI